MRCVRCLGAGLLVLLAGCGGPRAPTAQGTVDATPPVPADAAGGATSPAHDRQQIILVQDRLGQARTTIEDQYRANPAAYKLPNPHVPYCFKPPFPVLAPTDLVGFEADPQVQSDLTDMGARITIRLVDQGDPRRWVEVWQGMGCYGALAGAPPDATHVVGPQPVEVRGVQAATQQPQLQSWREPDGGTTVWLLWYSDVWSSPNAMYQLTGHNIPAETVIRIAAAMRPIE